MHLKDSHCGTQKGFKLFATLDAFAVLSADGLDPRVLQRTMLDEGKGRGGAIEKGCERVRATFISTLIVIAY